LSFTVNPLRPSINYMYYLLWQSVTLHFVFMCSYDSHCKQRLFP
jgi:hypothetical protein